MTESIVTVIIPCCNQERILNELIPRLRTMLLQAHNEQLACSASTLLLIDNGSSDRTWEIITQYINAYREVTGLRLRHRLSNQSAVLAGMDSARAYSDCVITMRADLRNDCPPIPQFLRHFNEGSDIVYGVRQHRLLPAHLNEKTEQIFCKLMKTRGVQLTPHFSELMLISRDVLEKMKNCKNKSIALQDIVSQFDFKSSKIYDVQENASVSSFQHPLAQPFHLFFGHYIGRLVKDMRQWSRQMTEQSQTMPHVERMKDDKRLKKKA
ncbi:MAG: glycosyltransferase [Sporolactobacillus sp.]